MNAIRKGTALFLLARPFNCLITALSVGLGGFAAGLGCPSAGLGWTALSAALIAGAGNAINDVVDLEIDRVNRPGRPLPSGRLGRRAAVAEALALALAGLGLAWWLGPARGMVASAAALALLLYSTHLKRRALWGNLAVSAVAAAAFPYGALAVGRWGRSWIPAGFAFLFHLGREIVKDLEDMEGDQAQGARTLPLRWGARPAAWLATLVYAILVLFTLIPWAQGLYGAVYLLLVLLLAALVVRVLVRLHRNSTAGSLLSRSLKVGMLLGLAAVAAGELGL